MKVTKLRSYLRRKEGESRQVDFHLLFSWKLHAINATAKKKHLNAGMHNYSANSKTPSIGPSDKHS